ncbi:MAG: pilus assembly protein PilP [Deltaproteobacteria bacterium]|nr:pilus assembly protein PilP [Deltaproteobacteria bacterium]
MKVNSSYLSFSVAILSCWSVLLLASCSEEPQKAANVTTAKQAPKVTTLLQTTVEQKQPYSYSPVGKRDPFYSYLAEMEASSRGAIQRHREPTESFELDQYRLTGVVTGTSQPRAMVEDPEGKGHAIKIGTRLGKRGGIVTRVSNDGIIVTEEFLTPTGDKVRVPITIKLPQPELNIGRDR